MIKRRSVLAATAGWTIVGASAVCMQAWPSGPVKIVVPYIPGGATDTAGRLVAEKQHRHRHGAGGQVQARWPDAAAGHDGSAPEAYLDKLKFETGRWTKVVKDNGIKVEG